MFSTVDSLLSYRSMIWNFIKREVRGRYKGSLLGFLWNFITPLVQILVYIVVFSAIFKPNIENYPLYLTSGMIVWIYFADSLSEGSWILMGNSDMLKKIYFPRAVLPIAQVLSKLVNFVIMLLIFYIIALITGFGISWEALLLLPVITAIFITFIIGITLVISALDVYFRDVQYIVTVSLMALVWLAPIMYSRDNIEDPLLNTLLSFNPMTYFIEYYQKLLYWKTIPDFSDLLICLILSLSFITVGIIVFKHLEKDFAEVL